MNHLFKYAQQKPCVVAALKILVKKLHAEKRPVKQIVEIGTYMGGFTQILKSIKEFETVPIHTFDVNLTKELNSILSKLEKKNVYFYMENIWTNETFKKIKNILVLGPNADKKHGTGGGSSEVKSLYEITPLEGLKAEFGEEKASSRYLYRLFKEGPAKQATKYAGLPKPARCI